MSNHKAYVQDIRNEHGQAIAREAKERADLKDSYKDDFKTYEMEMSRDDIDLLKTCIGRHPNVGKFRDFIDFICGDKGFWTEELTFKIVDHNTDYSDYDESKDRK